MVTIVINIVIIKRIIYLRNYWKKNSKMKELEKLMEIGNN